MLPWISDKAKAIVPELVKDFERYAQFKTILQREGREKTMNTWGMTIDSQLKGGASSAAEVADSVMRHFSAYSHSNAYWHAWNAMESNPDEIEAMRVRWAKIVQNHTNLPLEKPKRKKRKSAREVAWDKLDQPIKNAVNNIETVIGDMKGWQQAWEALEEQTTLELRLAFANIVKKTWARNRLMTPQVE